MVAELFSENEMVNSYAELSSIGSGEKQNIKININENKDTQFFERDGCRIQRFCPYMNYDLERNSEIDLDKNIIRCQGHCWEWDLDTGKGLNTNRNLIVEKI